MSVCVCSCACVVGILLQNSPQGLKKNKKTADQIADNKSVKLQDRNAMERGKRVRFLPVLLHSGNNHTLPARHVGQAWIV